MLWIVYPTLKLQIVLLGLSCFGLSTLLWSVYPSLIQTHYEKLLGFKVYSNEIETNPNMQLYWRIAGVQAFIMLEIKI